MKVTEIEGLEKGLAVALFKALAPHLKKAAELHGALHKAHSAHASFLKGKHDGMADDDMHKAYFGKAAEHHEALAGLHKDHAEHCAGMASEETEKGAAAKAAGDPAAADPAATVKAAGLDTFLASALGSAQTELAKSPDFQKMLQGAVMEAVSAQLKTMLVPTAVKTTGTVEDPKELEKRGLHLVARPGTTQAEIDAALGKKEEMPATLAHFG